MINKKGIILINAYSPELFTGQVKRFAEEFEKRGVRVDVMRNDRFLLTIKNGEIEGFTDADFCLYLDKDKYISVMLEKRGVRVFNTARAIEICDDKMTTHIELSGKGIPMPDTVAGLLCYDDAAALSEKAIDDVIKTLSLPVIVKRSFGSLGKGVYKADTREELIKTAEMVKPYSHLFQKYIKSSHGRDMRVIVVGGHALGAIIRSSDSDFRSNIGLGGRAEKAELPSDVKYYAEKAANALGLDYCGMDFLFGDSPLLCEVNSNAFFSGFESVTGINVASAYVEHILSVI